MKLFAVYFGWKNEKEDFIESHDIVFVVAKSEQDAKEKAKEKTVLKYGLHIDGIINISIVDWYDIVLAKSLINNDKLKVNSNYQKLK